MTDTTPSDQDNTPESPCPVCPLLRRRLHDVEEAAENYLQVIIQTGDLRVAAHDALVKALTVDFKTAILSAHDISDVTRKFWLDQIADHEAKADAECEPIEEASDE